MALPRPQIFNSLEEEKNWPVYVPLKNSWLHPLRFFSILFKAKRCLHQLNSCGLVLLLKRAETVLCRRSRMLRMARKEMVETWKKSGPTFSSSDAMSSKIQPPKLLWLGLLRKFI